MIIYSINVHHYLAFMKVGNEHIYKLTLLLIDGLALIDATGCSESSYIYVSKYMFMLDVWMHIILLMW